ncbi:hypothetical protein Tco_0820311 [Tanacetum coccineum]|uniref:Uncharacterized protein n=1 Tax=Tanacetum coccineum TaxID=301880 RepID=A0ABQ5AC47_9ASTR
MSKRSRKSTKGEASSSQAPSIMDKIRGFGVFESATHQHFYDRIMNLPIQFGPVVDWTFFARHGLADEFFQSINKDDFAGPQWEYHSRTNPTFEGVSFRLGGETRTMSLLEFGWRVGLYDEEVASHEDTVRT